MLMLYTFGTLIKVVRLKTIKNKLATKIKTTLLKNFKKKLITLKLFNIRI